MDWDKVQSVVGPKEHTQGDQNEAGDADQNLGYVGRSFRLRQPLFLVLFRTFGRLEFLKTHSNGNYTTPNLFFRISHPIPLTRPFHPTSTPCLL